MGGVTCPDRSAGPAAMFIICAAIVIPASTDALRPPPPFARASAMFRWVVVVVGGRRLGVPPSVGGREGERGQLIFTGSFAAGVRARLLMAGLPRRAYSHVFTLVYIYIRRCLGAPGG